MNDSTLNGYTSTMTDWLQTNPLNPKSNPAIDPVVTHNQLSRRASMFLKSGIPSRTRLLTRDTIRPTNPQATAPGTAEASATRQATFEKGKMTVKSHVKIVQTG